MRKNIVVLLVVLLSTFGANRLFSKQAGISGYCTLPATSGITIQIEGPSGSFFATTNSTGFYSINMSGAATGTYSFHATDGTGHHYASINYTSGTLITYSFALGV